MESDAPLAQPDPDEADTQQPTNGQTNRDQDFSTLIASAQDVLTTRFAKPIQLTDVECLSDEDRRNRLLRCHLDAGIIDAGSTDSGNGAVPTTVIIKQVVAGNHEHNQGEYIPSDILSMHTLRFMSDWVGAQFVSEAGPKAGPEAGHGPHFYGGDLQQGFIILEDLGSEHHSLVEPLLECNAESGKAALIAFASRLGQMHGDGMTHLALYEAMAQALHPDLMAAQIKADELRTSATEQPAKLAELGFTVEPGYGEELLAVVESILDPGPFLTYIHGDPCPDNNVIYPDGSLRLIDFEMGFVGHALLDITYARMLTPTCWCCNRVPTPLVEEMEAVYRTALANQCPAAADDAIFEAALVDACAYWLSLTLRGLPNALEEDWDWGLATYRPRIMARLESFIEIAQKTNRLPAILGMAEGLHEALAKRWPEMEPLPLYPAFR